MPALIDHLAELTASRDRDQLDACVARAVHDVLGPLEVAVWRPVGEPGRQRWRTRARIDGPHAMVTADPPWSDPLALPALEDVPVRAACLLGGVLATAGGAPELHCFPLQTELGVVGVLELRTAQPLTADEVALVGTVARIFGNVLGLLDHSERDPLTGLLNRQTFHAALIAPERARDDELPAVARPRRSNRRGRTVERSSWLGVIDIDHFKRVNDGFGHPIGDEVLLLLARLIRSTFRDIDRLYRIGGEEFAVVLEGASDEQAQRAFERLRANVESFVFPQVGRITVSIGTTLIRPEDSPTVAFARADRALYHVKHHDRNGVAHYETLLAEGRVEAQNVVGDVELF